MSLRSFFTMCWGLAIMGTLPGVATGQALSQPEGWETRAERFVAMPPGFHITTSPSLLFYHPDARAEEEFEIVSEGFLFRGESPNRYGIFVGGRSLANDEAAWVSLEIGHDGAWVVRRRRDAGGAHGYVVEDVAGPEAGPVAVPGEEMTAKNVLGISATTDEVAFSVNGETVTVLPRADLAVDGVVGFRVGADLNLHLTTLSITSGGATEQWAPAPAEGEEAES